MNKKEEFLCQFDSTLLRFENKGEKTGWTYIEIPRELAEQLNPGVKKSFRVKGLIDKHPISGVATIPMGAGDFIIAVNASMRKAIRKKEGSIVQVHLSLDKMAYQLNPLMLEALSISPLAKKAFAKMPKSHQNYYSKWIENAKQIATQEKRIVTMITSLERGFDFAQMIREQATTKRLL